jgi:glycine/D-amino acid oxidase-like deaminating enzyme
MTDYATKSFWLGATPYEPNPPLGEDIRADVAIVGGGFTGMSTAYELRKADPSLRVVVLESDVVGYGASGRNGGFAMTLMGLTLSLTKTRFGKQRTIEAHNFASRAVDHVGDLVREHNIDCDYEKNGLLTVATTPPHIKRLQDEVRLAEDLGFEGVRWLDQAETRSQVNSPTYLGARYEEQCALINPAKLVRGMKNVAMGAGAEIYEETPVLAAHFQPRLRLETPQGSVAPDKVVFATNAFSVRFPKLRAKSIPVYTYIVLTEPLSEAHFEQIGWYRRQGVEDGRNLIHYYRLTADNRLLMGGHDVIYYYGNGLDGDQHWPTFSKLEQFIPETFPALADVGISHRWGGPLSVPVDFFPAAGYLGGDKRIVYSLTCVGHGVAPTNLMGLVIRDLALEQQTDLTDLFFVNRRVPPSPPEPLRFTFAESILAYMRTADGREHRQGLKAREETPSPL